MNTYSHTMPGSRVAIQPLLNQNFLRNPWHWTPQSRCVWAQAELALQLRVAAEAAATLCRGVLTLALLKAGHLDVGIALSLAQVQCV